MEGYIDMNRYEYEQSRKKTNGKRRLKKSVKNFISRVMITIILFLVALILLKKVYEKYFGTILSVDKIIPEEEQVFSEKIDYKKSNVYKDGVELTVQKEYLVPSLESGIVVFMGEKEEYGTTVIIQQINGVDVWYANIDAKDIKMYDYVKKGTLIGQTKSKKLYLVFQKEGKYLSYKEYI